jgi:hypothetical protein
MKKQQNETVNFDIVVSRPKELKIKKRPLWRSVFLLIMVTFFSAAVYGFSTGKKTDEKRGGAYIATFSNGDFFKPIDVKTTSHELIPLKNLDYTVFETQEKKQRHRVFSELRHYFQKLQHNHYYFVTASLMSVVISLFTGRLFAVRYIKEKKFNPLKSKGEKIVISSTIFRDALKEKKSFNGINWKF